MAFVISAYFLGSNIYPILASVSHSRFFDLYGLFDRCLSPILAQAEAKATRLLIVVLAMLHLGMALSFKILFFSYYVIEKIGADIPIPGGDLPGTNTTAVVR